MRKSRAPQRAPCNAFRYPEPCVGRVAGAQQVCATDAAGIRYRKFREAGSNDILIAEVFANEIKVRGGKEAIASDLTYDLRSGDPDFIDQLVALTFGNLAFDAILDGKTGLMSAMVNGCYDLVPIPDAKLGPRKVDVATMYNTERYRPIYVNKRGLPIFLSRG
jgi:6-phosphofructokinase